jgi:Sec-independent protein translocase protein TatA
VGVGSTISHMWSWIVIGVCYVLVIGGFRILGGIGAAGDALRDWGRASSNGTHQPRPSS